MTNVGKGSALGYDGQGSIYLVIGLNVADKSDLIDQIIGYDFDYLGIKVEINLSEFPLDFLVVHELILKNI
jgi:hypothetical protein